MPDHDEIVLYLIFRSDLQLPKGKAVAQAGHGVQLAIRAVERSGDQAALRYLAEWEGGSYTKIALKVENGAALDRLAERCATDRVIHARVVDEGRTVIEPGTTTVLALQPLPKSLARPYAGDLRLF